jgi:hypothetical protein
MVTVLWQRVVAFATTYKVTFSLAVSAFGLEVIVIFGPAPALAPAVHWLAVVALAVFVPEIYAIKTCDRILRSLARWFLSQVTLKK